MFTGIFGGTTSPEPTDSEIQASSSEQPEGTQPAFDIWSLASVISTTVKARADEFVKSVQDTDWKAEISAFSTEVSKDTKTLSKNTAEFVEHLPEVVEQLPQQLPTAEKFLPTTEVTHTLEEVGTTLSSFGRSLFVGTKELIEQVKDAMETEISAVAREQRRAGRSSKAGAAKLTAVSGRYSRFEAEVSAMQRDSSTYCDVPEDKEDYEKWRSTFQLKDVQSDIDKIIRDNAFMAELQSRIVPVIVEREDFWTRYFYRFHKLQQKEEQRQQLAQRAKALQDDNEEDLAWDDDEEEEDVEDVTEESEDMASEHEEGVNVSSRPQQDDIMAPPPSYEEAISGDYKQVTPAVLLHRASLETAAKGSEETLQSSVEELDEGQLTEEHFSGSSAEEGQSAAAEVPVAVAPLTEGVSESPVIDSDVATATIEDTIATAVEVEAEAAPVAGSSVEGRSSTSSPCSLGADTDGIHAETASDESGKNDWCVVTGTEAAGSDDLPISKVEEAPAAGPEQQVAVPRPKAGKDDDSADEDWGNWD